MSLFFTIKITPATCAQALVCNNYAEHLLWRSSTKVTIIFETNKKRAEKHDIFLLSYSDVYRFVISISITKKSPVVSFNTFLGRTSETEYLSLWYLPISSFVKPKAAM